MNQISIAVKISNFSFALDYLSSGLNLKPTLAHLKGEDYTIKGPNGNVQKVYKYSYWEYRHEFRTNEWVQALADKFY